MPEFRVTDFGWYALDYLQTHPGAQFALLGAGVLLAILCARHVAQIEQDKQEAREQRARVIAFSQDRLREDIQTAIRRNDRGAA